jgi:hypothetical protein
MNSTPRNRRSIQLVDRDRRIIGRVGASVGLLVLVFSQAVGYTAPKPPPVPPNALPYSRGFLVTGDYRVAGITTPAGTIAMQGVPADADLVGALLFWEAIHSASNPTPHVGATFDNQPIPTQGLKAVSASLLGNTATCWGAANQLQDPELTMFQADVLSLLPKRLDLQDRWTGKYVINGSHAVTLPDGGSGNLAVQSGGATLVAIYRDPAEPLRKVVIYHGAALKPEALMLTQTIAGFYGSDGVESRLTHLVGAGGNNNSEVLRFKDQIIATDPFTVAQGAGRTFNTVTFELPTATGTAMPGTSLAPLGETVSTTVMHSNTNQSECLAWGAILFSTKVADIDLDGLPDALESATTPLQDPDTLDPDTATQVLPNLKAMGAIVGQKDLIVEINAMDTGPTSYGSGSGLVSDLVGHSHLPPPPVLDRIGDRYLAHQIHVHFDVGDPAVYRSKFSVAPTAANAYLINSGYAGGEMIQETACTPEDPQNPLSDPTCQFPHWPGTVGWPLGFQILRDAPVGNGGEELTPEDLPAWKTGQGSLHRRRFDFVRRDYVHYLLYAHARAKPVSLDPCLSGTTPTGWDENGTCAPPLAPNPEFHTPRSISGVAHLPGGGGLITLGLWNGFVGSEFVQASTSFHEIGHNLNLWHGGFAADFGDKTLSKDTYVEPNCKPNYLSSMSYLFQAHGLFDANGDIQLDYSGTLNGDIGEDLLTAADSPLPFAGYAPAWLAPANSTLATSLGATAFQRYCSGKRFDPANIPAPPMARVYVENPSDPINWDGGYVNQALTPPWSKDVNFDGTTNTNPKDLREFNDWDHLLLNQIGAGREFALVASGGELTADAASGGELTLDLSGGGELVVELGSGLELTWETGSGGELTFDLGLGGELTFDPGSGGELVQDVASGGELTFDPGSGGELTVDLGEGGELALDSASGDDQEMSLEHAKAMGRPFPYGVTSCLVGIDQNCTQVPKNNPLYGHVELNWQPTTFGHVLVYRVERKRGGPTSTNPFSEIGTSTTTQFFDTSNLSTNEMYTYRVRAEYDDAIPHILSPYSRTETITILQK